MSATTDFSVSGASIRNWKFWRGVEHRIDHWEAAREMERQPCKVLAEAGKHLEVAKVIQPDAQRYLQEPTQQQAA
jgi:hypothetical protein